MPTIYITRSHWRRYRGRRRRPTNRATLTGLITALTSMFRAR